MLQINELSKSFEGKIILNNVSFKLLRGQISVLVGESGTGKSTLLRCLTGLECFDTGSMILDNQHILSNNNYFNVQGQIGLVFQNYNLFPHLTILENLTLAPLQQLKLSHAEAIKQSLQLLNLVNLSDKVHNYPCELSGGQQQRVAIARACALNPNVLCFDEPTSALDPNTIRLIIDLLNLLKSRGLAILIITHDMNFAHLIADQLMTLKNGILSTIKNN